MSLASGARTHGLAGNCTDEEGPGAWKAAPGQKDMWDTAGVRAKPTVTPTMAGGGRAQARRQALSASKGTSGVKGMTFSEEWEVGETFLRERERERAQALLGQ
jgi:hypothetical protein